MSRKGHPEYYQDLGAAHRARARRLFHQPVRQSRQSEGARDHDRARDLGADAGHGSTPSSSASAAAARSRASRISSSAPHRRSRSCSPIRRARCSPSTCTPASSRRKGRGWSRASARTSFPSICDFSLTAPRLQHSGRRIVRDRARAAAAGRPARRLIHRHAARRGAALLPRADRHPSASSPSPATPATSTSRSSTTISGWKTRASSSARPLRRPARPDRAPAQRTGGGHGRAQGHARPPRTIACATPGSRSCRCWTSDRLIGVLTEEDIMRFGFGHPERLSAPVREAMQTAFISVPKEMPVNNLVSILQVAPYAAVMDGTQFLGLITRTDVLNYLRRQPGLKIGRDSMKRKQPGKSRLRHARIHAGQSPGSNDGRGDAADLRDLDLRAEEPRRAPGLRVLAHAESDAHGLRALHRRPRGRHARLRVRLGHGRDRDGARADSTPAATWSRWTISTAARGACSSACGGARRDSTSASSISADTAAADGEPAAEHAPHLDRDADAIRRCASSIWRRSRGSRASATFSLRWTTRSRRRGSSGRSSSAATSWCIRRPSS